GGASTRLGDAVHIFNTPVPRPQLRWSPDSSAVSLVGLAGDRPQVFAIPISGAAPRALTSAPEGVFAHEWSPDGKSLAYLTRDGGTPRVIVDRPGINNSPRYSPDGQWLAFSTTNGITDIMASRSLAVVPARGGPVRTFGMDDAWVNEYMWARDSKSIYFEANDGTFGRGEHMFDQPIARLWVGDGHAERLAPGQPGACAP